MLGRNRKKLNSAMYGEVKQVIVLRSDLKMSKGKSSAQASHASVSAFIQCKKSSQEA
ncbi:MAG: peptidyl-tRNA hydrolase, partial [archaeon]